MAEMKYDYKSLIVNPGGEIPSDQEVNEREVIIIIIISNLSNDRSKASSKTIPPHSAN